MWNVQTIEMCRISTAGVNDVLQRHIWKKRKFCKDVSTTKMWKKCLVIANNTRVVPMKLAPNLLLLLLRGLWCDRLLKIRARLEGGANYKNKTIKKLDFSQKVFSDRCIGIMFWVFFFVLKKKICNTTEPAWLPLFWINGKAI